MQGLEIVGLVLCPNKTGRLSHRCSKIEVADIANLSDNTVGVNFADVRDGCQCVGNELELLLNGLVQHLDLVVQYYVSTTVHKLYLSAILDLCDRRIASFALRNTNDSVLVHETLDQAVSVKPGAHPLFYCDRGFQYTSGCSITSWPQQECPKACREWAIDNGSMEDFWCIHKREQYYGRRFTSREQLSRMIREYTISAVFNAALASIRR